MYKIDVDSIPPPFSRPPQLEKEVMQELPHVCMQLQRRGEDGAERRIEIQSEFRYVSAYHTIEYTSLLESLESYEHLEYNSIIIIADGTINGSNEPVHQLHSQIGWTYDLANCDAEPISKGDTIGLIEVVEYTSAIPAFCPAVGLTEFELDAHPVTEV